MDLSSENNTLHPREIVSAYADLIYSIDENKEPKPLQILPSALPESLLPFPSATIRHALAIYLLHQNYIEQREIIEDAYIYLDNFIPDDEYSLFYMMQSSINTKVHLENRSNNKIVEMLDTMNRLRIRTQNIIIRKEESFEELNALRRIMGLADNLSSLDSNETSSEYKNTQELRLNI